MQFYAMEIGVGVDARRRAKGPLRKERGPVLLNPCGGFLRRLLDLLDETDAVYKHGVIVVRHALEQNRMIAR